MTDTHDTPGIETTLPGHKRPDAPASDIETRNDWLLGTDGEDFMFVLGHEAVVPFDANTGLRMAAWLVAMCEHQADNAFDEVYQAVCNT